ncbi:MAG: hypothetical protein CM15mP120_19320 [Pseudomonadota bacterium]|nr:MAG: hypothetical protein CM15mP120_19320 [Pseudomonadota bacterium]
MQSGSVDLPHDTLTGVVEAVAAVAPEVVVEDAAIFAIAGRLRRGIWWLLIPNGSAVGCGGRHC